MEQKFNFAKTTFKTFFTSNELLDKKYVNDNNENPTIFKLMTQRNGSNNEIFIRLSNHNLDGDSSSITDDIKIFEIDLTDDDKLSYTDVTYAPFRYNRTNPPQWYIRHNPQNSTTTINEPFIHILINELKDKKDNTTISPHKKIVESALIQIIQHIVAIATLSQEKLTSCKKHLIEIIGKHKNLIDLYFEHHIVSRGNIENDQEHKRILNNNSTKITYPEDKENYNYMDFLNSNPGLKINNMIVRLYYSESYKGFFFDIIVKIIDSNFYIFSLDMLYPSIVLFPNYDKSQDKLTFSTNSTVISYEKIYDMLVSKTTKINKAKNINDEKFAHIGIWQDNRQQIENKDNYIAYIIIYNPQKILTNALYYFDARNFDNRADNEEMHYKYLTKSKVDHTDFSNTLSEFASNNFTNKNKITAYFDVAKKDRIYKTNEEFRRYVDVIMEAIKNN